MKWFHLIAAIVDLLWIISVFIWLIPLNYRQRDFEKRCQKAKDLQDKANAKMLIFIEQINKDIEKLEDRTRERGKGKG